MLVGEMMLSSSLSRRRSCVINALNVPDSLNPDAYTEGEGIGVEYICEVNMGGLIVVKGEFNV